MLDAPVLAMANAGTGSQQLVSQRVHTRIHEAGHELRQQRAELSKDAARPSTRRRIRQRQPTGLTRSSGKTSIGMVHAAWQTRLVLTTRSIDDKTRISEPAPTC